MSTKIRLGLLALITAFVAIAQASAASSETFSAWLSRQNVPENQRGMNDDPAGDGVPNLVKYALGLEALTPSRQQLPRAEVIMVEGQRRLAITITKNPQAVGVEYNVQVSPDLITWGSDGLVVVNETSESLTVADTAPLEGAPRRFLRLAIPEPTADDGPLPQAYLFVLGGRAISATHASIDPDLDKNINENFRSILVADVDVDGKTVTNWRRAGLLPLEHPELVDDQGVPRTVQWNYIHNHVHVHNGRLYVGSATWAGGNSVTSDFVAWADIDYRTGTVGQWSTSPRLPDNQRIGATALVEVNGVSYYYIMGGSADPSGQTSRILYAAIDAQTGAIGAWNVSTTSLPAADWFNAAIGISGHIIHTSGNLGWNSISRVQPASGGNITSSWTTTEYTYDIGSRWDHVALKGEAGGNSFLYLVGGATSTATLNRVDRIPVQAGVPGMSTATNPLPAPRRRLAGASHADMLVIPGGSSTTAIGAGQATVFIGSVAPNGDVTWTTAEEPMLQPRSFHGATIAPVPQN